ncbi:aminotransferase, class I/II domain protein [Bordetella bronchiseptica 980-2]|nr:aminotransferase, class I/II domain protein [Bordetella bronchiseptica 980-2]
MATVLAAVGPGDEVVVIEPCYDSYLPAIRLAGGTAVPVRCRPRAAAWPASTGSRCIRPRARHRRSDACRAVRPAGCRRRYGCR